MWLTSKRDQGQRTRPFLGSLRRSKCRGHRVGALSSSGTDGGRGPLGPHAGGLVHSHLNRNSWSRARGFSHWTTGKRQKGRRTSLMGCLPFPSSVYLSVSSLGFGIHLFVHVSYPTAGILCDGHTAGSEAGRSRSSHSRTHPTAKLQLRCAT